MERIIICLPLLLILTRPEGTRPSPPPPSSQHQLLQLYEMRKGDLFGRMRAQSMSLSLARHCGAVSDDSHVSGLLTSLSLSLSLSSIFSLFIRKRMKHSLSPPPPPPPPPPYHLGQCARTRFFLVLKKKAFSLLCLTTATRFAPR